jgi:hypothetical protein
MFPGRVIPLALPGAFRYCYGVGAVPKSGIPAPLKVSFGLRMKSRKNPFGAEPAEGLRRKRHVRFGRRG